MSNEQIPQNQYASTEVAIPEVADVAPPGPESTANLPISWEQTGAAPAIIAEGVHIGQRLTPAGDAMGYVDESETPVSEAGIVFGVSQASHGPTSIYAKAMPGFKAEALRVDPQTHETTWVTPYEGSDEVKVAQDLGNGLQDETGAPRLQAELGNEGVRSGVVRVTNAEGDQKYYVLGAKFEGKPDDWNVTGAIAEVTPVTPDQPHALPGVRLELPAGE